MQIMNRITLWVATCFMVLVSHTALSAEPLFSATYQGKYGNLNITMVRELNATNNAYQLSSKAKAFAAKINEYSTFSLQQDRIIPQEYAYQRKVFGVKKAENLKFDWQNNKAWFEKGSSGKVERELKAGSLDPTLYQLQLQRDIARNPQQKTWSYLFARRKQTKRYTFEKQGSESITLKDKAYSALVYARVNDGDKETRFWLIPELDYVIAKIQHNEEDKAYEVTLKEYKSSAGIKSFLAKSNY